MSSITATRTTRPTRPAAKPASAGSRRRLTDDRSSVVGRADRPVLRIVVDNERAPVVTRITPPTRPAVVEPSSPSSGSVEPVETIRRVALDDFFAAEYDGDDVRLQVVAPHHSTVRLTHRGRVALLGVGLAAALGLGLLGASQALAGGQPEPTRVVTVQPGQTLWDIASAATPAGGDVRSMVSHLQALNHLDSAGLQVGQHLRVPR